MSRRSASGPRYRLRVTGAAGVLTIIAAGIAAAVSVAGTAGPSAKVARPVAAVPATAAFLAHRGDNRAPIRSCESLATVSLPNVTINSAVLDPGSATTPRSCRINATSTHPPMGDRVTIDIWLPVDNWNGRFQGTGGGGFSG